MTPFAPGLEALFILLRDAGIQVGVQELGRLAAVFDLEPDLDEDGLYRVIEATVVKSVEQRGAFARVYRKWFDTVDRRMLELEAAHDKRRSRKKVSRALAVVSPAKPAPGQGMAEPGEAATSARLSLHEDIPADTSAAGSQPGHEADDAARAAAPLDTRDPPEERAPVAAVARLQQAAHAPRAQARPSRRPAVARWLVRVTISIVAVWGGWHALNALLSSPRKPTQEQRDPIQPLHLSSPAPERGQRLVYEPEIEVVDRAPPAPEIPMLGYGLMVLSLGLGVAIWKRAGRGRWLPSPHPRARERTGRQTRAPATSRRPLSGQTLILDEREQEDLVWGVGRFVSDQEGRDLDVARTVDETASAFGRPILCFESQRYQREAWLWVDESLDTPAARHLASDLTMILEASGLPVTRATFWGIPEILTSEDHERITIDAFDARRDSAAIAILTDGRLMSAAHRARDRRDDLHALLRSLGFWPRVTFIDFGPGGLGAIAAPHGLEVIKPQDAPAAISDLAHELVEHETRAGYEQLAGDAKVWAAACALTPRPVSDRTALALRRALRLEASPWVIELMRDSATGYAGGLSWSVAHRAAILAWLVEVEELPASVKTLPRSSLLARIVHAWDHILDEREREQRRATLERGVDWQDSLDAREIELERAFIRLWDRPRLAVATLYGLFHAGYAQTICALMRDLAPREVMATDTDTDMNRDEVIVLPWRLRRQPRATQVMLRQMGFGARAKDLRCRGSMPRPGRLWLAVALAAGLAAGAASELGKDPHVERPPVLEPEHRPDKAHTALEPPAEAGEPWQVQAMSLWSHEPVRAPVNTEKRVVVRWRSRPVPCEEHRDTMEIRRCTSEGRAPRTSPERWSFAIIAKQDAELARNVAQELLDSGSVDGAFLVEPPIDYASLSLDRLARPAASRAPGRTPGVAPEQTRARPADQLLLVVPEPWPELPGYPGRAVFLSVNHLGALRGILDFARDRDATLAERLRAAGLSLSWLWSRGDLDGFVVRGLGECGQAGQRCCGSLGDATAICDGDLRCEDQVCRRAPPAADPAMPGKEAPDREAPDKNQAQQQQQ